MDGYLLVDKPTGLTSHDVVARVRHILRQSSSQQSIVDSQRRLKINDLRLTTPSAKPKVGHTGTLDPLASGLMILVLGSYTKRAQEFSKLDKTYEVELTLGKISTTGDSEGKITDYDGTKTVRSDQKCPDLAAVEVVLKKFVGEIEQTPPAFSAIKVNGQRAYKLARQGKDFKIEPRQVTIYSISDIQYKYPKLSFITEVSSGTYIRSLAEDIGQKLGTGAYVSALRRTKVGKFDIKNAVKLEKFLPDKIDFLTEV